MRSSRILTIIISVSMTWTATNAAETPPANSRPAADAGALGRVLQEAKPGEIVTLPDGLGELASIPKVPIVLRVAKDSPQLLFSDDPEYFRGGDGVALQEDVRPGRVRLYVYHVPASGPRPKTITAIIENRGDQPMRLRMLRSAFPKPGKDYHRIGKAGLVGYFTSKPQTPEQARTLAPGGRMPVDAKMDASTAMPDELVHGLYEFEIDQPARISVLQRNPDQDSLKVVDTLPKPPPAAPGQEAAGAGRGLYLASDIDVTATEGFPLDPARGAMQLVVADGKADPWITGRDAITGKPTVNQGNYGVIYRIRLKRVGTSENQRQGMAVLLAHGFRASKWCGQVAAAVQVNGRTIALPGTRTSFEAFPATALIALLPPLQPGKHEDLEILYSPPGASCLPTPILFVPFTP